MKPEETVLLQSLQKQLWLGEHVRVFGSGVPKQTDRLDTISRNILFFVVTTVLLILAMVLYPLFPLALPFMICIWVVMPILILWPLGSPEEAEYYALTNERLVRVDTTSIDTLATSASLKKIRFKGRKVTVYTPDGAFEIRRISP